MEGAVNLLPGPQQRCLLRVAVLDDDMARKEWERWRAGGGTIDGLDHRSQALLPSIYRRLYAMGVDDPDMARLKGTYRHRWCENVDALRAGRAALSVLAAAGTGAMVFKGAALMIAYGRDPGARPMGDVDLVVRPGEARAALELLLKAGFRPIDNMDPLGALRVRRGINLSVPDMEGKQVDLHWSTLPAAADGDDVFERGRHTVLLGFPTLVPSPTDLLLSIVSHGTNWYPEPVRWVLDSCYLLSSQPGDIDWDLLVAQARHHRYAWPVGVALDALQRDYGAVVPLDVARSLLSTRGDVVERAMWRVQRSLPQRGVRYPFLLNEWLRARRQPYPGGSAGGLLSFVEDHMEASGPLDLVRKLWPQLTG